MHKESYFFEKYKNSLLVQLKKSKFRPHVRGLALGISQSVWSFAYGVALFYGSYLIVNKELDYQALFK